MIYTYIRNPAVIFQDKAHINQKCQIVQVVYNSDFNEDNSYIVQFGDGVKTEVVPEELSPIPPADTNA